VDDRANPEDEPLYERRAELIERVGQTQADWAINVARNLCLYPNVYLMDQFSSQIRQYRPIAVDKTEVTIHCIAPKGESAQARAARIRRYEDFFNATGMATPDDLEEFRASQNGYLAAPSAPWNDMSRGATHWIEGPDDDARAIGINPLRSGVKVEDEGLYPIQHRYWQTAMQQAVVAESKSAVTVTPGRKTHADFQEVEQFLYREARMLDDRDFEGWLEYYAPDAEFWMPAWDDDDTLSTDPQREISLIWYGNRGGLEDRVFRIRTERSSATSIPEPRTGHNITNVEILGQTDGQCEVRFNWFTLYYRYEAIDTYFGTSFYTLDTSGDRPLIKKKKVILKSDYIHHVVDIYHV
jgi:benzoate/toluate 1,2-dioxygenase beta subunit